MQQFIGLKHRLSKQLNKAILNYNDTKGRRARERERERERERKRANERAIGCFKDMLSNTP